MSFSPLTVQARAKLNLHLHLTGRRDSDGYHTLDSLVIRTTLADTLTFEPSDSYRLTVTPRAPLTDAMIGLCPVEDNLVTKIIRHRATLTDTNPSVAVTLIKSIPAGAGLGGGSADAAATLTALGTLFPPDTPPSVLIDIASKIGSDIVACLSDSPVLMRDTGNTILPAPRFEFDEFPLVIVSPLSPCPTPAIYKRIAAERAAHGTPFSAPVTFPDRFGTLQELCAFLKTETRNDMTAASIAENPDVGDVLTALENLSVRPLLIRLSGSGSACYAVFASHDDAKATADALSAARPSWQVEHCSGVGLKK